jgi:hypothetical protein
VDDWFVVDEEEEVEERNCNWAVEPFDLETLWRTKVAFFQSNFF